MSARPFALPLLLPMILAATAIPCRAQRQQFPIPSSRIFEIAGTVWDDNSRTALEMVRVDLRTATGDLVNSVFSDSNGGFDFMNVTKGQYTVAVDLKDYDSVRQPVMIIDGPLRGISIFLHKTNSEVTTTDSSATISAHQLSVPGKAREAFDKGETLLYVKSNYQAATEAFDRAIKDFASYYEAYEEKGVALMAWGKRMDAEAAFQTSIDLSRHKYPEAMFMLAALWNDTERYADAELMARAGVELDSSSWRGHLELARALVGLKKPDEAETHASQALAMKPDQPAIYLVLANIHIQKRDGRALLQDLNGYLKVAPNGPQAEQARKTRDQLQASLDRIEPPPPPDASQ